MAASAGVPHADYFFSAQIQPITVNANGDNVVIAGVTGQSIYVLAFMLSAASAVVLTPKTGSSGSGSDVAISGTLPLTTAVLPGQFNPAGWWATAAGEGLNLFLSSGVAVNGSITYFQG